MLARRFWFPIVAFLLAVGLPVAAFAGGWSTVTLDSTPGDLVSGKDTTIGFTVLQHGRTPLVDQQPRLTFTNLSTDDGMSAIASAEGAPGHYTATFALKQPGKWRWTIDVFEGPHAMPELTVVAAPAPAPQSQLSQTAGVDWPALAGALALAAALGLAIATGLRRRGQPGPVTH